MPVQMNACASSLFHPKRHTSGCRSFRRILWRTLVLVVAAAAGAGVAASPLQAQAFTTRLQLELDYLYAADHDHKPDTSVITALIEMFRCQNVLLTIEISDAIPEPEDLCSYWASTDPSSPHGHQWYRDQYFDHHGQTDWKYGVLVHDICDRPALGAADPGPTGQHFFVATYPDDSWQVASYIAHEFGHTLGLQHGGNEDFLNKINYPSIMNYLYLVGPFRGVNSTFICQGLGNSDCPPLKRLDYSHGTLPPLVPTALDESAGLGFGPIDWNCNGVIDASLVSQTIATPARCRTQAGGESHVFRDHDDWAYIHATWGLMNLSRTAEPSTPAATGIEDGTGTIVCVVPQETVDPSGSTYRPISNCYALPDLSVVAEGCSHPYAADSDDDGIDDYCDACPSQAENTCCCYVPGDANGDGFQGYPSDRDFLIAYVYLSGPPPPCHDEGDASGDGVITAVDIMRLTKYFVYGHEKDTPVCGVTGL